MQRIERQGSKFEINGTNILCWIGKQKVFATKTIYPIFESLNQHNSIEQLTFFGSLFFIYAQNSGWIKQEREGWLKRIISWFWRF